MKNIMIIALFGVTCCITGSNAFFGNLMKMPKFRDIFKTIGMPITFPPPFRYSIPQRISMMTTRRTTTTTPPPPPPTTLPPATTTLHPDDITIALCNEAMSECPWTSDELVEKIIERNSVGKGIEYNGEGESVGPTVDPAKVGDKIKPEIGATKSPGSGKGIGKGKGKEKGVRGGKGAKSRVPQICLPFGRKIRNPAAYVINCINYLSDTTIPHYTYRRKAMLGCFKCRYLCELGGALQYL